METNYNGNDEENCDENVDDNDSDNDKDENSGERSVLLWKPGKLRSPGTEMLQNHI